MSDPKLLVNYRYIVDSREFAVLELENGERRIARIIGWADHLGRPSSPAIASYLVVEFGSRPEEVMTRMLDLPPGYPRRTRLSRALPRHR